VGDAALILHTYLKWGERCPEHLLGDFAFAIWDGRRERLFCARDQVGMKPFYYHHSPRRFLAFGSEPRAVLGLPQVPYRINEGRIADFIVDELEGIDQTSTFFEEVHRLPPAHSLAFSPAGLRIERYWSPEPGPELHLSSDREYGEAFLEVFEEAVRCRLRSHGPVASMLSGGVDSGSVVAVASELLARAGRGPLRTFSATSPQPSTCVETRTILSALSMSGLAPRLIHHGQLADFQPDIGRATWQLQEPFDNQMTLVRTMYLAAEQEGIRVVLDGVGGDIVLASSDRVPRLLRSGSWKAAFREATAQEAFWGEGYSSRRELLRSARSAVSSEPLRRLRRLQRRVRSGMQPDQQDLRGSCIDAEFARRVRLDLRLLAARSNAADSSDGPSPASIRAVVRPHTAAGRARYERTAATHGVEPRDPFLDLRVMDLCARLPGHQRLRNGWPKAILRHTLAGRLPAAVRWRRGKQHLGWAFSTRLLEMESLRVSALLRENVEVLTRYVDLEAVDHARSRERGGDAAADWVAFVAAHVAAWLHNHAARPYGPVPTLPSARDVGTGEEIR
jgi:asparagine synthase (glutamine-hydrolysing)